MARIFLVALLALLSISAFAVTPVEKVINLIDGLQKEVKAEGEAEATAYDNFACFCKDTTITKSKSVNKQHDKIKETSATIEDKTAKKAEAATDLAERKVKQEENSKKLDEETARCAKDKATYAAEEADAAKAISSLKKAINSMKTSKSAASLLAIKSAVTTLSKTTLTKKQRAVSALLQQRVDPANPDYDFHSNGIVDLCTDLLKEFEGNKAELDDEEVKRVAACTATKAGLNNEITTNKASMDALDAEISKLKKEIATAREGLIEADSTLKDDQLYLKDLQERCEARANDYDQRSALRGQEAKALAQAYGILSGDVKTADTKANERALLQTSEAAPVSFLQAALVNKHSLNLRGRADTSLELEARKNRALDMLRGESRRMGSVMIAALTARAAADPFKKVKALVQSLIERLLKESEAEATKKGFCDTSIAEAEHDRNRHFNEAMNLNRELRGLEAKRDELDEEITTLTADLIEEKKELSEAEKDRNTDKGNNEATLKTAKEGFEAVTEALVLLQSFYSQAAKASSLLQASPVTEAGPGFSGSYSGKQGGMKAVFALLETIKSDFDRTIRNTEKEENADHRAHVKLSQQALASIGGKETKKELDGQDLKSTKNTIQQKTGDLKTTMELLDKSLQELEQLKPSCIDTGMSYKERVAKREEEMTALKKALCILDADKVEPECK